MSTPLTRHRRWPLAAAAAVLALTLVGCGDDSDGTATDPEGSSSSTPSEDASTTADPGAGESTDGAETGGETGEAGELPAWAPKILTEGDLVTGLDFTDTPEPTGELQIATVIEGDGPPVEVGQTITANYFGSVYDGDTPFDESYSSQPFQAPIGVGSLIPGWDQEIPGIPVGSRIIMSIPPDQAYGDADQPGIPGGSTLFFVIDIIAAE